MGRLLRSPLIRQTPTVALFVFTGFTVCIRWHVGYLEGLCAYATCCLPSSQRFHCIPSARRFKELFYVLFRASWGLVTEKEILELEKGGSKCAVFQYSSIVARLYYFVRQARGQGRWETLRMRHGQPHQPNIDILTTCSAFYIIPLYSRLPKPAGPIQHDWGLFWCSVAV